MMQAAPLAGGSGVNTTTTLYSPVFSTVGYTSATLIDNEYYSYFAAGDSKASLEYSIDGGTTWVSLVNRLGATFGTSTFNVTTPQTNMALPAATINQPSVQIRWSYVSVFGNHWAIDNVKIKGTPIPSFTWAGPGSTDVACSPCAANTVTPTTAGTNVYTVTATGVGCSTTGIVTMTVNPLPAPITGTPLVCEGLTTSLATTSTGGTWQSSSATNATIDASGVVTAIAFGTTNISYTYTGTGCRITQEVTVNPTPAPITGTASVCVGATTALNTTSTGGTWSNGTPAVASLTSTGVAGGVEAGVSDITYTYPTGCLTVRQVTVDPLPFIVLTPSVAPTICEGDSVSLVVSSPPMEFSLLNQNFNLTAGLGLWTITSSGNVDGVNEFNLSNPSISAAGATGDGSAFVEAAPFYGSGGSIVSFLTSPVFSTVGFGSATLTFNEYLFSAASSDPYVDVEYSTDGGTSWTTLLSQRDSTKNYPSGTWSVTTPDVSVALPISALNKPNVKLRWHYESTYGGWWDVDNIAVKAALPAATFTWAGVGSATGLSCNDCDTVKITPAVSGANVYNVTANSTCSSNTNVTVSVNPLPAPISGATTKLCVGNTINLGNADAGGSWSCSNAAIATVDPSTGALTGVATGTAAISYTLPTTCARVVIVTVNAAPSAIVGTMHVCEAGFTTALTHAVPSGTWTSGNATLASIDAASGVVTGNVAGSVDITYALPSGCYTTSGFVVNPTPDAFAGSLAVCEASTTTLGSASTGGTWFSTNTAAATVDLYSGILSGVTPGNTDIVYTLPTGCQRIATATVNVIPSISGADEVCENATTVETAAAGGAWTIAGSTIATVDAAGTVSGVSAGTTVLSFTQSGTGCVGTKAMTVNQIPATFSGTTSVCEGATTSLINPTPGGTWTSASANASVDGVGLVTGNTAGTASIIYTLPTTCARTATVSVLPVPAPVTGTPQVCVGGLTSFTSAPLGGTWNSSNSFNATVDAAGNVTGVLGGTSLISYTSTNGCVAAKTVTVNVIPPAIGGVPAVCENATTTLTNGLAGGTWSSSTPAYGSVDALTGVVSGVVPGTTSISYTLAGCSNSVNVVINALPVASIGTPKVCEGLTTTLVNTTTGGTWTTTSSSASVGMTTGVVTGIVADVVNISYTLPTGCSNITLVTVNALPANIAGPSQVCQGSTITLSDITSLGTWSSDNTTTAGVDASGNVTGGVPGSANIVYTAPNGCVKMQNVVVDPLPAISGPGSVCESAIIGLTGASAGGAWSSLAPGTASVDAVTGNVTGVAAGTTTITYSLLTGCSTTANVIVKALPASIAGIAAVCPGTSVSLSSITVGGTWSNGGSAFATVNTSGVVTGITAGTAPITYTGSNGCAQIAGILVNPAPATYSVTGGGAYCAGAGGSAIGLSSSDASVLYQLYNGSTTVGAAIPGVGGSLSLGTFTAVGTYTVFATSALTGCTHNMTGSALVSITPSVVPAVAVAASGGTTVCAGSAVTFTASPVSGGSAPSYTWSVNGMPIVSGSTSATFSYVPVNGDIVNVTLTSSAACATPSAVNDMLTMTVNPLEMPVATITLPIGVSSVCDGSPITINVTSVFGGASPVYTWYKGGAPTGVTGTTYTYVPTSGDPVYCQMISSFGCVVTPTVNSNTLTMITTPVYVPAVSISVAPGTVIASGTPVAFTALTSSAGPAPTYQWYKNGAPISGETNSNYITSSLVDMDSISCRVTGTDPCGYESFNSVIMRVKGQTSGLSNIAGGIDIALVPNPNNGEFVIKGSLSAKDHENVKFEVLNILGQIVYSGNATVKGGSINESIHLDKKLANGMYMLSLYTNNETHVFHFVLEQ